MCEHREGGYLQFHSSGVGTKERERDTRLRFGIGRGYTNGTSARRWRESKEFATSGVDIFWDGDEDENKDKNIKLLDRKVGMTTTQPA